MRSKRKSRVLTASLIALALLLSACSTTDNATSTDNEGSDSANKKTKLTLMFAWPDDVNAKKEEELVKEHFADKYDITFKPVDNNVEKTIKTTISAGEPVDLAFYWTTSMETFVKSNMALDLTPYLEENNGEWKDTFVEGSLDGGTIDGKIYAVPNTPVYPLMLANKDLLDKAGVTLSDNPTWDEFMLALATIKEKLGISPVGISNSWANWALRNNLLTIWPDEEKFTEWTQGKIPFNDPTAVKAFDAAKEIYDKDYAYPGKGALTATLDQVSMAFKSEKVAIIAYINYLADSAVKESGLQNVQVLSFPYMGPEKKVMGGFNGYMIPANVEHPEASVEVLKYLTSKEVLQYRVDNGSPVPVKDVTIKDPKVAAFSKDTSAVSSKEVTKLSSKMEEYFNNKLPANYIFNQQSTLKELEKLRLESVQK